MDKEWMETRGPEQFPLGTQVRKISGSEWDSIVIGYYSGTLTKEGLVLECTAPGARYVVHVEPAKRVEPC